MCRHSLRGAARHYPAHKWQGLAENKPSVSAPLSSLWKARCHLIRAQDRFPNFQWFW